MQFRYREVLGIGCNEGEVMPEGCGCNQGVGEREPDSLAGVAASTSPAGGGCNGQRRQVSANRDDLHHARRRQILVGLLAAVAGVVLFLWLRR